MTNLILNTRELQDKYFPIFFHEDLSLRNTSVCTKRSPYGFTINNPPFYTLDYDMDKDLFIFRRQLRDE